MADRLARVAALAAQHHGIVSAAELDEVGVSSALRSYWVRHGRLLRLGPRSFALAGVPLDWTQRVAATSAGATRSSA